MVGQRSKDKEEENKAREEAKEAVFEMDLLNLIKSFSPIGKFESNKLTLAGLLEVLDGMI